MWGLKGYKRPKNTGKDFISAEDVSVCGRHGGLLNAVISVCGAARKGFCPGGKPPDLGKPGPGKNNEQGRASGQLTRGEGGKLGREMMSEGV